MSDRSTENTQEMSREANWGSIMGTSVGIYDPDPEPFGLNPSLLPGHYCRRLSLLYERYFSTTGHGSGYRTFYQPDPKPFG